MSRDMRGFSRRFFNPIRYLYVLPLAGYTIHDESFYGVGLVILIQLYVDPAAPLPCRGGEICDMKYLFLQAHPPTHPLLLTLLQLTPLPRQRKLGQITPTL